MVGRRGPVQAACTAKELREILGKFETIIWLVTSCVLVHVVSAKFLCLLVGIKDLYIHIQDVDLRTTPADEVYLLTYPISSISSRKKFITSFRLDEEYLL